MANLPQRPFLCSDAEVPWEPIPASPGAERSTVETARGDRPYRLAKWKAAPGIYERPNGMRWDETFVVYAGSGRLRSEREDFALRPGVIVNIEKGVPYILEITATLEKLAIVTKEECGR